MLLRRLLLLLRWRSLQTAGNEMEGCRTPVRLHGWRTVLLRVRTCVAGLLAGWFRWCRRVVALDVLLRREMLLTLRRKGLLWRIAMRRRWRALLGWITLRRALLVWGLMLWRIHRL